MIRCPRCHLLLSQIAQKRLRNYRLRPKEMEAALLLFEGMPNREIAKRMKTTPQVIKNYLNVVYRVTGASDRLELVVMLAFREDG